MIQHKQKDNFVILYCPRFLFINEDEMNEQREREIIFVVVVVIIMPDLIKASAACLRCLRWNGKQIVCDINNSRTTRGLIRSNLHCLKPALA